MKRSDLARNPNHQHLLKLLTTAEITNDDDRAIADAEVEDNNDAKEDIDDNDDKKPQRKAPSKRRKRKRQLISIGADPIDPFSSLSTQQWFDTRIVYLRHFQSLRFPSSGLTHFFLQNYADLFEQAEWIWTNLAMSAKTEDHKQFVQLVEDIDRHVPASLSKDVMLQICLPRYAELKFEESHRNGTMSYDPPGSSTEIVGDSISNVLPAWTTEVAQQGFPHCMTPASVRDVGHIVGKLLLMNPQRPPSHQPYPKILLKADPRKGARRSFPKMIQREMAHTPAVTPFVWSVLLCGIQGNYPHCATEPRASLQTHWYIQGLFGDGVWVPRPASLSALSELEWRAECLAARTKLSQTLIGNCRFLVEILFREFILYHVGNSAAVETHWRCFTDVDEYRKRVFAAAAAVRAFFRQHCSNSSEALLSVRAINTTVLQAKEFRPYETALNKLCYPLMTGSIVKCSFRDIRFSATTRYKQEASAFIPNSDAWRTRYKMSDAECTDITIADSNSAGPSSYSRLSAIHHNAHTRIITAEAINDGGCTGTNGTAGGKQKQSNLDGSVDMADIASAFEQRLEEKQREVEDGAELAEQLIHMDLDNPESVDFITNMASRLRLEQEQEQQQQQQQQQPLRNQDESARNELDATGASSTHPTESTFRVTWSHCAAIQELVPFAIGRNDIDHVVTAIVRLLHPHFGSPKAAVDKMLELLELQSVRQQSLTKDAWEKMLRLYARRWPYTACLVYCICCVMERYRTIQQVPTSLQQMQGQVEAFRERGACLVPGTSRPIVSDCRGKFVMCRVCLDVYSLITTTRTTDREADAYGLRDVQTQLLDLDNPGSLAPKIYCRENYRFGTWTCSQFELVAIGAIGQTTYLQSKAFEICPQAGCGNHWLVQIQHSAFNSRGPSCWVCTQRILRERIQDNIRSIGLGHDWDQPRCYLCGGLKKALAAENAFMYGPVAVCKQHHSAAMIERMNQLLPPEIREDLFQPGARQLIEKCLLQCKQERKQACAKFTTKRTKTQSYTQGRKNHFN